MKTRLAIIFGGESVEHEISIISAQQVIEAVNKDKYEVIPVYISKKNEWYTGDVLLGMEHFKDLDFVEKNAKKVKLIADKSRYFLYEYPFKVFSKKPLAEFDVAFPVVHGTNVEDGTIQGLFASNKIPFVGPTVSGGAVGQDKVLMKLIWQASQLPILPYIWCYSKQWSQLKSEYVKRLIAEIGFPMIIKPASLGSSIGIAVAKNEDELISAMDDAVNYDEKIIVEQALVDFTEMNCSVLGNSVETQASAIEKVFGAEDFLSFEDKYQGGKSGSKNPKMQISATDTSSKMLGGMANTIREIPAILDIEMEQAIKGLAELAFKTLGMTGVSRIDFLVDNRTNKIYLNEINTIPGSLSFYLWQAAGIEFSELIDKLVKIAITRFREHEKTVFTYDSNVLAQLATRGSKGSKFKK
ncbi:D-alanine-D-alanine ligase A [Erysipelotrichaceae bacterium]|nr:D-alanine-D-alanine ligase A [Erysipelotrichaceae bacterium]